MKNDRNPTFNAKVFAIVVGFNGADGSKNKLEYAQSCAKDYADSLRRMYPLEHIRLLAGENATRDAVLRECDDAVKKIRELNLPEKFDAPVWLILYWVGHAYKPAEIAITNLEYFHLTTHAESDEAYPKVGWSEILQKLKQLKPLPVAVRRLFVVDTCYSALIVPEQKCIPTNTYYVASTGVNAEVAEHSASGQTTFSGRFLDEAGGKEISIGELAIALAKRATKGDKGVLPKFGYDRSRGNEVLPYLKRSAGREVARRRQRLYESIPESIPDEHKAVPYVNDSVNLFNEFVNRLRGRVGFVAGEPLSGKSTLAANYCRSCDRFVWIECFEGMTFKRAVGDIVSRLDSPTARTAWGACCAPSEDMDEAESNQILIRLTVEAIGETSANVVFDHAQRIQDENGAFADECFVTLAQKMIGDTLNEGNESKTGRLLFIQNRPHDCRIYNDKYLNPIEFHVPAIPADDIVAWLDVIGSSRKVDLKTPARKHIEIFRNSNIYPPDVMMLKYLLSDGDLPVSDGDEVFKQLSLDQLVQMVFFRIEDSCKEAAYLFMCLLSFDGRRTKAMVDRCFDLAIQAYNEDFSENADDPAEDDPQTLLESLVDAGLVDERGTRAEGDDHGENEYTIHRFIKDHLRIRRGRDAKYSKFVEKWDKVALKHLFDLCKDDGDSEVEIRVLVALKRYLLDTDIETEAWIKRGGSINKLVSKVESHWSGLVSRGLASDATEWLKKIDQIENTTKVLNTNSKAFVNHKITKPQFSDSQSPSQNANGDWPTLCEQDWKTLYDAGKHARRNRDFATAYQHFNAARHLAERALKQDNLKPHEMLLLLEQQFKAMYRLAGVLHHTGNFEAALLELNACSTLFELIPSNHGMRSLTDFPAVIRASIAKAHGRRAAILLDTGKFGEALKEANEAYRLNIRVPFERSNVGQVSGLIVGATYLSQSFLREKDLELAAFWATEAIELCGSVGIVDGWWTTKARYSRALIHLAKAKVFEDQPDKNIHLSNAENDISAAEELLENKNDKWRECELLTVWGILHRERRDLKPAEESFNKAFDVAEKVGHKLQAARIRWEMGRTLSRAVDGPNDNTVSRRIAILKRAGQFFGDASRIATSIGCDHLVEKSDGLKLRMENDASELLPNGGDAVDTGFPALPFENVIIPSTSRTFTSRSDRYPFVYFGVLGGEHGVSLSESPLIRTVNISMGGALILSGCSELPSEFTVSWVIAKDDDPSAIGTVQARLAGKIDGDSAESAIQRVVLESSVYRELYRVEFPEGLLVNINSDYKYLFERVRC